MIRKLGYGESPPEGEPRRFKDGRGYVRLRWRVGPSQLVEVYEHRWVTGAGPEDQVHHINGDKGDNRVENLKVVSPSAHRREHAVYDDEEMERLYLSGMSTVEVGEVLGCDPSVAYRRLKERGTPIRNLSDSVSLAWSKGRR